jgi:hypothetical protein
MPLSDNLADRSSPARFGSPRKGGAPCLLRAVPWCACSRLASGDLRLALWFYRDCPRSFIHDGCPTPANRLVSAKAVSKARTTAKELNSLARRIAFFDSKKPGP